MTRRFSGDTLLIASHNGGKVREIADLLRGRVANFPSAADHGLTDPEETGETFRANAELKALTATQATNLPALADDSGLAVTALDGAPGIYSARWAERADGKRDFDYAMGRVNDALGSAEDRRARFICALCLAWPDGHVETVEGSVDGTLTWPRRGGRGFGYDPIFVPEGHAITFGEMEPAAKHAISHRADAFKKLLARCFP
ncbi:MAG: RdgB/HAM1 family non-canonical purine NTP pyrophosphatase [Pseudomonadota bacterium]